MADYSEIKCPSCNGEIMIDAKMLLRGGSFSCTTTSCDVSVSLSSSSHSVTNHALDEFEKAKRNI